MGISFCIPAASLRAALAEIEQAERNGFHHCLAVFELIEAGPMLSDCRASYSDLVERASPTDKSLDWGRFQCVSKKNCFIDGKLVPIESVA